jgi:hypothetical protein
MAGPVKGGLFVGAAVAVGLLAGLLIPLLVVADREPAKRPGRSGGASLPTMPSVIGRPLDDAEDELARHEIDYETDASAILETVAPTVLEVCDAHPPAGQKVHGTAHLRAKLAGTCEM